MASQRVQIGGLYESCVFHATVAFIVRQHIFIVSCGTVGALRRWFTPRAVSRYSTARGRIDLTPQEIGPRRIGPVHRPEFASNRWLVDAWRSPKRRVRDQARTVLYSHPSKGR